MYTTYITFIAFLLLPFVTHSVNLPLNERDLRQDPFCNAVQGNGCDKDANGVHTYANCCSDANTLMVCAVGKWVAVACNCKVESNDDASCCVGLNDYGGLHDLGCPGTTCTGITGC